MIYEAKNYENLLGVEGLSDELLKTHFTLYQGYVTNTNKLIETMSFLVESRKISSPEFAELKRRLGWEFNGMRLHEYYFENISKNHQPISEDSQLYQKIVDTLLYQKIVDTFGSFEKWQKAFQEFAAIRGIGWVVFYLDNVADRFLNVWVNEHDVGHPAGCQPLLVIDVFEHAYMLDYGIKKPAYIEAIWKIIDWKKVEKRFSQTDQK